MPKWRNWQTRYVQGVVGESPWEFESALRHHASRSVSETPSPENLDLMVLRHLRGFPDELHRFSNAVKQAHGRSAVDLFLSRPAPPDSFLAALCRAVLDGTRRDGTARATIRFRWAVHVRWSDGLLLLFQRHGAWRALNR